MNLWLFDSLISITLQQTSVNRHDTLAKLGYFNSWFVLFKLLYCFIRICSNLFYLVLSKIVVIIFIFFISFISALLFNENQKKRRSPLKTWVLCYLNVSIESICSKIILMQYHWIFPLFLKDCTIFAYCVLNIIFKTCQSQIYKQLLN